MLLSEGAGRSEACGEQSHSKNAPKRAGIILIYGDMVFHATTVMVNEAGLSCFLLRSGRLERIAEKTGGIFWKTVHSIPLIHHSNASGGNFLTASVFRQPLP